MSDIKPICVIQAPFFTFSGYGRWAEDIAKSLIKYDKYEVLLIPTRWGHCSKRNLDEISADPIGMELLKRILRGPLNKQPELFIQISIPNEFLVTPQGYLKIGRFNIGMTASIETTAPPGPWIEGLNRMDLNIVMSKHGRDVLTQAQYSKKLPNGLIEPLKVTAPVEILFWGADTKKYYKTNSIVESLENKMSDIKEDFAFLFVGQWTGGTMNSDRKSIGWLIKTFLNTFKGINENKPCLILKTNGATLSHIDKYECIQKIKEVTDLVKSENPGIKEFPNIYLLHGELNDTEMNALYNHKKVKVNVSFAKGEGFGGPLLLSTLSGKPLFAPNWSGHLDFLNPQYANLLEGKLEPIPDEAVNDWFIKESQWFVVDYAKAEDKLRRAFYNYDDLLSNAEKLRVENAEKFSLDAMDKKFYEILEKYVPVFSLQQNIILPKLKKITLPKLNKIESPPTSSTNS